MDTFMGFVRGAAVVTVTALCIWGLGSIFAGAVSDYEVIEPETAVKCVVVSRMFNTSVSCWRTSQ